MLCEDKTILWQCLEEWYAHKAEAGVDEAESLEAEVKGFMELFRIAVRWNFD